MKIHSALNHLSRDAARLLSFVMKNHKRKTLVKLYHALQQNRKEVKKEILYHAAFESPYEKSRDYLLRNEIRLLNAEIKEVNATIEFQKAYRNNGNIRAYWDNRAHPEPLPEDVSPDIRWFSYDQYGIAADMLESSVKLVLEGGEVSAAVAEKAATAALHLVDMRRKDAARRLSQAWLMYAAARRWQGANPGEAHWRRVLESFQICPVTEEDPVAGFLFEQAHAAFVPAAQKTETLFRAVNQLEKCTASPLFQKDSMMLGLIAVIGLEYFMAGKYETASQWYQKSLEKIEYAAHPQTPSILFNILSNLAKAQQYDTALKLAQSFRSLLMDSEQAKFPFLQLMAMLHLFAGQPHAALLLVPEKLSVRPDDTNLYFRLIRIMAFSDADDPETAEREAGNLLKMIRYRDSKKKQRLERNVRIFETVANWLHLLSQAAGKLEKDKQRVFRKLSGELRKYQSTASFPERDFLPLRWLELRLG